MRSRTCKREDWREGGVCRQEGGAAGRGKMGEWLGWREGERGRAQTIQGGVAKGTRERGGSKGRER